MIALKEISAHKNIIQKVKELNFDTEEHIKNEINELKARKDEELDSIILKKKYFRRSDRDTKEKRIDEIEKSRREKEDE